MNATTSQPESLPSLRTAVLIVAVLWAALYLPGLGTLQMKGEEARRTMPAMTMIETGNWLVPSVGGESYARKPPLLNWCIALVIQITHRPNEWSARLPSVLAVLLMAQGLLLFLRRLLGAEAALLAAAMYLVNATVIEKGRIAELESFTLATYGLAFLAWFDGEWRGAKFAHWLLAGVCLSLGQLTKGPMPTLLFFYLPVGLHLWRTHRLRELLLPGHLACLALTWLPFLIWSQWMFRELGADNVSAVWSKELVMRVVPEKFSVAEYLGVILRGVLNFLPWALFLPLLWRRSLLEQIPAAQRGLFVAVRRACVIGFVVVGCLPGARARYTVQLLVPLYVLLAWAMTRADLSCWLPGWRRLLQGMLTIAAAGALGVAIYLREGAMTWGIGVALTLMAAALWPRVRRFASVTALALGTAAATALVLGAVWLLIAGLGHRWPSAERQAAREIMAGVPPDQKLCAVRPGYERVLFYLGFNVRYVPGLDALPTNRPLFVFVKQPADRADIRALPGAVALPLTNRLKDRTIELWRLDAPASSR